MHVESAEQYEVRAIACQSTGQTMAKHVANQPGDGVVRISTITFRGSSFQLRTTKWVSDAETSVFRQVSSRSFAVLI